MKKMKKLLYIFSISIILFSCSEPIDLVVNEKDKKIVLNSIIVSDSIIRVHLSKSLGILEPDSSTSYIEGAQIELYENDIFMENLVYDTSGYYISTIFPELNNTYKLIANYDNLQEIEAQTSIPNAVPISNLIYDIGYFSWVEQWYDSVNEVFFDTTLYQIDSIAISITINDPVNEDNYYLLNLSSVSPVYVYPPPLFEPVLIGYQPYDIYYTLNNLTNSEFSNLTGFRGYLVSDELFNGSNFTFSAIIDYWGGYYKKNKIGKATSESPIYINMISVSSDFYNFITSRNKYDDTQYNPLAEPVNIFSNIKNGFGLFTGCSLVRDSVMINFE